MGRVDQRWDHYDKIDDDGSEEEKRGIRMRLS
jgi:hypothetical protein